jgi:hypothetical protein
MLSLGAMEVLMAASSFVSAFRGKARLSLRRLELKVVGVAVKDFTKLDGGAAQPEYGPAAVAGVSNVEIHAKRKTLKCKVTFIYTHQISIISLKSLQIQHRGLSMDETLIQR